jgi:class 3 adenylate cyclase
MGVLPSGTVTFLFTDIEGSTRLLRELGAGYAEALAAHRGVLRRAFADHRGVEVDTQGDAFFVAFARAADAVAAATQAQAALGGGPVRVRMGLHTGEPAVTDEGYVGVDVHLAARVAGVAHGGQILLTQRTRDAPTSRRAISASTGSRTSTSRSGCFRWARATSRRSGRLPTPTFRIRPARSSAARRKSPPSLRSSDPASGW